MKKALVILTISISAFGQRIQNDPAYKINAEQVLRFTFTDKKSQIDAFIDSALTLTKNKYEFYKVSDSTTSKKEYFKSFTSGEEKTLVFHYDISIEGSNVDLETPGVKYYNFKYISGPYLDVFPIWQKFIAKTADLNAVNTKESDVRFMSNGHVLSFQKRHPIWNIIYRRY